MYVLIWNTYIVWQHRITLTPCGLHAESELFYVILHRLTGHQFCWSTCITVRVSPCGVRALKARTLRLPSDRTPENPLRAPCQGPDKILTFGLDVCADPDNFRAQNPGMYVSQSGQFQPSRGGLCQSPDNFGRGPGRAGHIDMAYRMPPDASIQFLRSLWVV